MSDIINNGYQIWPVYYGHDVKYRVVKFISGEVAYERQFRSRDEADGYVIDVLRRAEMEAKQLQIDLEPIITADKRK